jgi:hypothetical protein
MIRTVEATITEQGCVLLREDVTLTSPHRALVTILEAKPHVKAIALLSEAALPEDWDHPEEEAAWSYLQAAQ